jgi:serine/threonine protein kinase
MLHILEHPSSISAMPTTNGGDLPAEALGAAPAPGRETQIHSNDPCFPTLPEVAMPSMSSDLRKAQVRAALFHRFEPVRIGRFILLERLGAGSMGEIYAAYDERLDRRVALKLVRHGSDLTVEADELLLREAKALAQVSHPNVVQIYEAGTHQGRVFIAMELIRGQTLTRWLEDAVQIPRPQRQREILRRFIAAGRGLEAAHAAGVAHRDFKPDNVLVGEDGRVCVVDFGLARVVVEDATLRSPPSHTRRDSATDLDAFSHGETVRLEPAAPDAGAREPLKLTAATRLTRTGTVMGTPRFMAPEQIRGGLPDQRSDQFSFCVALYHALYGSFPFTGTHPQELLDSIEAGVTVLEHSAGLAARVRKALCRGLSVEPSQRFATMGELLSALEPGLRRRGGWIAGAVLFFVAAAAALLWLSPPGDPCASAGDGIDAAWSAERQGSAHAAFAQRRATPRRSITCSPSSSSTAACCASIAAAARSRRSSPSSSRARRTRSGAPSGRPNPCSTSICAGTPRTRCSASSRRLRRSRPRSARFAISSRERSPWSAWVTWTRPW